MPKTKEAVLNTEAGISETADSNPETQIVVAAPRRVLANRRNAVKHGLLAKEIIAANEDNPKVRAEFNALLTSVRENLSPVGALEEMHVDIIAACYWRLARVMRFELRQANRAVTVNGECLPYRGDDDSASDDVLKQIRQDPEGLAQRLDRSSEIIEELIDLVHSEGHVRDGEIELLRIVPGDLWQRCAALQPKPGVPHWTGKWCPHFTPTLKELEKDLPWIQRWKDVCLVVQRNPGLRALVMQPDIPDAQAIERILRYEPMLHRQLNKAMDQLERLQRRRKGESVPPPVNAHVSLEQ